MGGGGGAGAWMGRWEKTRAKSSKSKNGEKAIKQRKTCLLTRGLASALFFREKALTKPKKPKKPKKTKKPKGQKV